MPKLRRVPSLLCCAILAVPVPGISSDWPAATATTRPWTRWWWPGNAVDRENLTRQLEEFARVGIGGVEITPIYGARGFEERYIDFLSPQWMAMLAHVAAEAKRLGMRVDMATGTGWPFGGPWVEPGDGIHRLALVDETLGGSPTGMKVKRAGPGGAGLVVDPYSSMALERYLAPFEKAFTPSRLPDGAIRAQFHDSFEYYEAGWTPRLAETFRAMHGYDLAPHAAELLSATPKDPDHVARLKADYRAALARLHLEYLTTWTTWSHRHGFIVRNQSHGAPANLLDLYGAVDIPETETFGFTPFAIPGLRRDWTSKRDIPESLILRMASSAAHVMGRPLVSSESCTWLREHWQDPLAFAKPEIDRLFVDGINHVFYHGTVYSPKDVPWPGWLFYASTQFNPSNPWWEDFAELNAYVTRVQSILQAGRPDNRVLLYWPFDDTLHRTDGLMLQFGVHDHAWVVDSAFGRLARRLYDAGFHYDAISDSQLLRTTSDDGALATPGARYDVLVVPEVTHLPVETLEHLLDLRRSGAKVIFESIPGDVPGLGRLEERRARLRALIAGARPALSRETDVLAALRAIDGLREPAADAKLRFVRRANDEGNDYFFANLSGSPFDGWVPLGVEAREARLLDPLDGRVARASLRRVGAGRVELYLQLEPGESIVARTKRIKPAKREDMATRYFETAGAPHTISGEWRVAFIKGGPEMPEPRATRELKSWTDLGGDKAAQRFAGTARYRIEFTAPRAPADDWMLDLGDVRESARVRLNGRDVGVAWSIPFRLRLHGALRDGVNTLEIDVTNTAANRIRDLDQRKVDWKIMHEINFVDLDYKPFDASGWPLSPAGLLGPVKLLPLKTK